MMERDTREKKGKKQVKNALKSYKSPATSLESRVADFLSKTKGDDSLADFALKLGIPRMSLCRYLKREQSMSLSTLQKIAGALGVKTEAMLRDRQKKR